MIIIDTLSANSYIDNIIFDIDGTITSWKNVEEFLRKSLNILGVPYTKEALDGLFKAMEYREFHAITTGESDESIYSMLLENYIDSLRKYGISGKDLMNTMFELEASETYISKETKEEIDKLSENYKLFAYTNWFKNQALKKLNKYDLTQYFSTIHSSEDNYIKFSKVGFLWLLDKYKLSSTKTVHIGDSKSDIMPSHKAGISSIYLDYNIKSADDINEDKMELINTADASINEFKDIRRVLTKF